jgi:DNA-binding beta-propeller fold protein YncE
MDPRVREDDEAPLGRFAASRKAPSSSRMLGSRQLPLALVVLFAVTPALAEIAVSANDGKQVLHDGQQVVPSPRQPDSITLIDLSAKPPRLLASIPVPASVIGPPASVAVAPDESYALVTASRRLAERDPTQIEPDDLVTVVDLKTSPPRVRQTLHAGAGASGVSINPSGTLALVANRSEGTVSVLTLSNGEIRHAGKVTLGEPASAPAQPIFFDNGRRALVTRDGDHKISMLLIDGDKVSVAPTALAAGLRPYQIDTAGPRRYAAVAMIGGGGRDVDTISLIDLAPTVPEVVDTVAVGLTPEGIKMSPDGRFVAVNVNNGSNASPTSVHYRAQGLLQVWRIDERRLVKVTQVEVGGWGQGIAWSKDSRSLLVQCMVGDIIDVFGFDGRRLRPAGKLNLPAGPAGIRTAEP